MYKVGKFVEWPSHAFEGPSSGLEVCILGNDGLAQALASVGGRTVQGRRLEIKILGSSRLPQPGDCHILYLSRSLGAGAETMARALSETPVLTISDRPGFARRGGMICLVRIDNRMGFEIDPRPVGGAGLRLEAQLLDLAEIVER